MSPNNGQSLSVSRHNSSFSGSSQKRQIERLKKDPKSWLGRLVGFWTDQAEKDQKIKIMNVETIILDEFDQLLSDSQYHFVDKISHYAPRDHQYMPWAPRTRSIQTS